MLALGCFALGLLSKPMLVTWPFVMLLLDYWPLRRTQNAEPSDTPHATRHTQHASRFALNVPLNVLVPLLVEKIPFLVLAALMSVVTFMVQGHAGALTAGEGLPWGARVGNALISYCRYGGNLLWPADLAVVYPHPGHWAAGPVVLATGVMLGLSVLAWVQRSRCPWFLMGWLWYCGTLVPVSQVVQTGSHGMADRYTYLPSLGALIFLVWGGSELTRRWRRQTLALSVAGGVVVSLCLALTRQQLGYWTDSEALFRHALAVTVKNEAAHNALGVALDAKGHVDEAIRQLQEAIQLNPNHADVHYNLGVAFCQQGRAEEAIRQFQEAIRLRPDHAPAHNNLGTLLGRNGQIDEAIRHFQKALELEPDYADARRNLERLLATRARSLPPPGTSTNR